MIGEVGAEFGQRVTAAQFWLNNNTILFAKIFKCASKSSLRCSYASVGKKKLETSYLE